MKLNFIYVRHGKTLFNELGLIQGSCDSPLTEAGIEGAEDTGSALRNVKFDRVYCSSSERAIDTCEIICKGRNVTITPMKGLKEIDFGDCNGESMDTYYKRLKPYCMCEDWTDVNGENLEMFAKRSRAAFDQIVSESEDGDTILVVSHAAYIMHLMKTLLNFDQKSYILSCNEKERPWVPNCSITMFSYEDGKYEMKETPMTADEYRKKYDPKKVTFRFVRHGETMFNVQERMQGWCDGVLSENGIQQCEQARELLKDVKIDRAWCSSTERTRDTASIILAPHGIKAIPDKRLREVYFGRIEGVCYKNNMEMIMNHFNTEDWKEFDGENHDDVFRRLKACMRDITDQCEDGDSVLLVSHGLIYLNIVELLFGISRMKIYADAEKEGRNPIPNCGILEFEYNSETGYELVHLM